MRVKVHVLTSPSVSDGAGSPGSKRPQPGSTVRVELRDTSQADAPSRLIASGEALLAPGDTTTVELNVDESSLPAKASLELSARAAEDQAAPRARGDWITMESFPWDVGDSTALIRLRPIT